MSAPVTTIQVVEAADRDQATAYLREAVGAAHALPSVLRLTLHESEDRPGQFVLIGAAANRASADDAFVPLGGGLAETARNVLDPIVRGQIAKGTVSEPIPAGRVETTRVFIAILPLHPGKFGEGFDLLDEEMEPTHGEEGVHRFVLNSDPSAPDVISVVEAWRFKSDWRDHQDTPYYQKVIANLPALMPGDMTVYTLLPIAAGSPDKGAL